MRDFTLSIYFKLLKTALSKGFHFQTFANFIKNPQEKVIILRHDVDKLPGNALKMAEMENSLSIQSSYYFRIVPCSYNIEIIKKIKELGHEIGYHYEDMVTCKGDIDMAFFSFCRNLTELRKLSSIETICMHGSPLSKYDNREIWTKYNFKELNIIGEPYLSLDYSKILYITDTGRRLQSKKINIRDKDLKPGISLLSDKYIFKSTTDLINIIENSIIPHQMMINFHPQRWSENIVQWYKELIYQNLKNQIKRILVAQQMKSRNHV